MNKLPIIIIVWLMSSTLQGMGKSSLISKSDQQVMDAQLARRLEREVIDTRFPLHAAIRSDNEIELTALLNKSEVREIINVPHAQLKGCPTALHEACQYGTADMVQRLLICGANTEAKTVPEGATPLNFLMHNVHTIKEDEDIALLLLDSGADVNTRDADGDTPLHGACRRGSIPMVLLLLQRGAQQQYNNKHQLPGMYAANNIEIQRLLKCTVKRSTALKIPLRKKALHKQHDDSF